MTQCYDAEWPRAGGMPAVTGALRVRVEDFAVEEQLGFEPAGHGDHALLRVCKRNLSTEQAARLLARHAGTAPRDVGFAGRKDQRSVSVQWFSVPLSRGREPDWRLMQSPALRVLAAERHPRKLRRGAHRGNRFTIRVRELVGDRDDLARRLERLAAAGAPNYFGPQRFGQQGANVARSRALFRGVEVRDRVRRGFYLSAARSWLFNETLSMRVADGTWDTPLAGDVLQLDGRGSVFVAEAVSADVRERTQRLELHPTAPLWGRGELISAGGVAALEAAVAHAWGDLAAGLENAGVAMQRRALRTRLQDLAWGLGADGALEVRFVLPPGSYATAVLRECLLLTEVDREAPDRCGGAGGQVALTRS